MVNNCLRIVYYHLFSDTFRDYYPSRATLSLSEIENHIIYFKKRFNIIGLSEALMYFHSGESLKNCLVLTTDDGFRDILLATEKVFNTHGVKLVHFLNNSTIDNLALGWRHALFIISSNIKTEDRNILISLANDYSISPPRNNECIMDWSLRTFPYNLRDTLVKELWLKIRNETMQVFLEKEKPYLNSDEVNYLLSVNHEIGSHSYTHPDMSKTSKDETLFEVEHSMNDLNIRFNTKVESFSFPFGRDVNAAKLIQEFCPSVKVLLGVSESYRSNTREPHYWERTNMEFKTNLFKCFFNIYPFWVYLK